ncbi:MAG: hypothetical protein B7Z60_03365 [Ferrovum sp. 37-45-19]|nr:MAG: hypothetical protein B7Z65_01435 [Ferrovum sp. 21-44-67]OYV94846.1 MAG: hypothetical protein B7Z60_03365 [Ferrovum sp. 37-45-19]OZB34121.1 MAG: hypothetical protein B7X47_01805 [Ferrovum sp. 34-44-207]HQT81021.1 septal ring lytic transglycosylase RlpA family protein [Ferrovaceae bacterium]HQU06162.1 septal ring lytic transglycosylase RlpA family protein [Ferrovaceae bacterium]
MKALSLLFICLLLGCLSGCSTTSHTSTSNGGYYLDDGPESHPPANLDLVPNAVPRWEPYNRYANKPYEALGKWYYPQTNNAPYRAVGYASWYGRRYNHHRTASGEVYNMYAMTGAHTTLPIPCYVKVTNLKNHRWVIVRINDRGPFKDDRLIDLSYTAAYKLGILGHGTSQVLVERVFPK